MVLGPSSELRSLKDVGWPEIDISTSSAGLVLRELLATGTRMVPLSPGRTDVGSSAKIDVGNMKRTAATIRERRAI